MNSDSYINQRLRWVGASREDCIANNGMVASKHPLISKAGIDAMKRGGNAVDAAIAAAFMDCVVEPPMNGIGGEGVMAIHLNSGENIIVDYVGRPSKDASLDMYERTEEEEPGWMGWYRVLNDENKIGHKACTVPGTVAGLTEALYRYGTLELDEVMEPAIEVAEEGFVVNWWNAGLIFRAMRKLWKFDEWKRIFLHNGELPLLPYTFGMPSPDILVQRDLAKSLRSISEEGGNVFYEGWIAEAIVEEIQGGGGILTLEDFAMYEPIVHQPDLGSYRGYQVLYDPTHSGTTMMQILKILEGYDLASMGYGTPEALHLTGEAIGFAFADRFKYMGDPGFVNVPQKAMVSGEYAEEIREKISKDKAAEIAFGNPWPYEPECTTALVAADKEGNMVCVNQTNVDSFGCGVVVPGTGIVMNNAMYGLDPEPGHANSIDGRKRRIQNVCPTVLLRDGEPYMVLGAPGGRNIQVAVAQVILHVLDYAMGIQDAIDAPRVTRETSTLFLDKRFPKEAKEALDLRGHDLAWLEPQIKSWGRPVGIINNPETGALHGGVFTLLTGFISEAIGF
jgi:gamma-glutamyltranspeptidase/glutathione hydrolase